MTTQVNDKLYNNCETALQHLKDSMILIHRNCSQKLNGAWEATASIKTRLAFTNLV